MEDTGVEPALHGRPDPRLGPQRADGVADGFEVGHKVMTTSSAKPSCRATVSPVQRSASWPRNAAASTSTTSGCRVKPVSVRASWAMRHGSDTPEASTMTWSGDGSRRARRSSPAPRSSPMEQQTQPLVSAMAPKSLTSTPLRRCAVARRWFSSVVLPAPRKPPITPSGIWIIRRWALRRPRCR